MKKIISIALSFVVIISCVFSTMNVYSATKAYAQDKLESIQTTTGFIPGKTAAVTGNCYGFVSKVCEKLYGVAYQEGLYGNYKARHESGNYYTVATLTTGSATSSEIEKVINFFTKYATTGDIVHFGTLTSGTSNTSTHTFMVQSVDSKCLKLYHANYETMDYPSTACHIDTLYWDSWRENPSTNVYTSSGHLYSINKLFQNKMDKGGMGVTINRYTNYEDKYYLIGATVPEISTIRSSSTGIKVSWNTINGATKYQVQYKKSDDSSYTTASSTVTGNSYTINGLTTGTTYNFRVRAYVNKWMSYSDVDTKKVMPPTISVVDFKNTKTGIKMTWGKRSDITGVRIYRSTEQDGTYTKIATITDNSVGYYVDTTAKIDQTYYYKFQRYLVSDSTEYKTTSTVMSAKYTLAKPSITSEIINKSTIEYSISGDGLQTAFTYYVTDSDSNTIVSKQDTTNSTVTLSNLVVGKYYYFYCAEKNSKGTGDYTLKKVQALPKRLDKVNATQTVDGIKVSFDVSSESDGYVIYRAETDGKYSKIATIENNKTNSYLDKTISYATYYTYRVKPYVKTDTTYYGTSTQSDSVRNTTGRPSNLSVTRNTPTSVKFKWSKSDNATSYEVQYKSADGKWTSAGTTKSNSMVVSKLTIGQTYTFRVRAVNNIGKCSYVTSDAKKVMPPTPATPTTKLVSKGIKVYWVSQSNVTGYKIYRSTSKDGSYKLVATVNDKTASAWTDTTVEYNKTYYYKVVYYVTKSKKDYNSSKSKYVSAKYVLASPVINVEKASNSSALASYNSVQGASSYTIQYKAKGGSWVTVTTTQLTQTISSLKKGSKYYFRVKANSKVSSGEYSSTETLQF